MMYFPLSGWQFSSGQRDRQADGDSPQKMSFQILPCPFQECGLSVKIFQFVLYLISLSQTETHTDSKDLVGRLHISSQYLALCPSNTLTQSSNSESALEKPFINPHHVMHL